MRLLTGEPDGMPNVFLRILAKVVPVEQDLAGIGVAEADEQVCDGRLARPALPDERDDRAGSNVDVQAIEHPRRVRCIAHADTADRDVAGAVPWSRARGSRTGASRSVMSRTRPATADAATSCSAASGNGRTASNAASVSNASSASLTPASDPE